LQTRALIRLVLPPLQLLRTVHRPRSTTTVLADGGTGKEETEALATPATQHPLVVLRTLQWGTRYAAERGGGMASSATSSVFFLFFLTCTRPLVRPANDVVALLSQGGGDATSQLTMFKTIIPVALWPSAWPVGIEPHAGHADMLRLFVHAETQDHRPVFTATANRNRGCAFSPA
jgi:hypothetical protein